jgi:hypothetical protein
MVDTITHENWRNSFNARPTRKFVLLSLSRGFSFDISLLNLFLSKPIYEDDNFVLLLNFYYIFIILRKFISIIKYCKYRR